MRIFGITVLVLLVGIVPAGAQTPESNPEELQQIGVDEHLGDKVPVEDLEFISDAGVTTALSSFFNDGKPVLLTLYYSDCPMLCSLVLNGLQKSLKDVDYTAGKDFRLLTVSIDPRQTVDKSQAGRERFGGGLPDGATPDAWRFFTGDTANINRLVRAVGFRYFYIEDRDEYAHPAVVLVLSPDGSISRYLYGVEFKPANVSLALLEASEGKIGNTVDRILLYCYHYDPTSKGYILVAGQIMKLGGVLTLLVMGGIFAGLWLRGRKKTELSKAIE